MHPESFKMGAKIGPKRPLGGALGGFKSRLGGVLGGSKRPLGGVLGGWGAKSNLRTKRVRNWASKGPLLTPQVGAKIDQNRFQEPSQR